MWTLREEIIPDVSVNYEFENQKKVKRFSLGFRNSQGSDTR